MAANGKWTHAFILLIEVLWACDYQLLILSWEHANKLVLWLVAALLHAADPGGIRRAWWCGDRHTCQPCHGTPQQQTIRVVDSLLCVCCGRMACRSQKAAAIAASCNILPINQDLFQVTLCLPAVSYSDMWR
jgi:hypothetical protein